MRCSLTFAEALLTQLNDHIDAQRTLPDAREPRAGLGTRLGTKTVCYFSTAAVLDDAQDVLDARDA